MHSTHSSAYRTESKEMSLSVGLRVWCDHTDVQKGLAKFIFFEKLNSFIFIFVL